VRKKDYEAVAAAIKGVPLAPTDHAAVVAALSAVFAADNARFNAETFAKAATLAEVPPCVDPSTLTRILIDYQLAASRKELPTLESIVDVANEAALSTERAADA
jgi:hypothetical protein